jgi:hypothetical protein
LATERNIVGFISSRLSSLFRRASGNVASEDQEMLAGVVKGSARNAVNDLDCGH